MGSEMCIRDSYCAYLGVLDRVLPDENDVDSGRMTAIGGRSTSPLVHEYLEIGSVPQATTLRVIERAASRQESIIGIERGAGVSAIMSNLECISPQQRRGTSSAHAAYSPRPIC